MNAKSETARFRALLEARRDELTGLIATAHEQARTVELDQARVGRLSRMDALQGQAMAQETERRRCLDLNRVEAALKRLESGEYGYCAVCEEDIPAARLAFDPAITTCVNCASK